MKWIIAFVAVAIAWVFWRELGASDDTLRVGAITTPAANVTRGPNVAASAAPTSNISVSGPARPNPRPDPSSRALLEKFNHTQSYREFLFYAIQHPKQGGYIYAYAALGACAPSTLPVNGDTSATSSSAAASILKSRCDITTADRQDALRQLAASRSTEVTDDPLLKITFDLLGAKNESQKSQVLTNAFLTEDPILIRSLIGPGSASHADGAISFLGTKIVTDEDRQALKFALDLLECDLGADCSRSSTRALQICADYGWCGESVGDSLRIGFGSDRSTMFEQIQSLSKKAVDAVKKRNAGVFLAKGD